VTKVILDIEQAFSNCKSESELKTGNNKYINFFTAQKMIHKFLNCDRIIQVPTKILKFTEIELADKLEITTMQLKKLHRSQTTYKQMIGKINLLLIELYCNTKWT
jgi:hypothetical protein